MSRNFCSWRLLAGRTKNWARRGVSVSAVKKTWRLVYARVAQRAPEVGLDVGDGESRGREEKQRLLAYLREHPEELRPFARTSAAAALRELGV